MLRLGESGWSGDLTQMDLALHRREHKVTGMHPAQEPVELLKPLPPVRVRLVLVTSLNGPLQIVIAGTRIKLT